MIIESTPLYGFISTGDKVAMYTLRIMFLHVLQIGRDRGTIHRPDFIKILSNDKAKAETIAAEICADYGVPFKGNAEFELNEIRRARDEEKAEKLAEIDRIFAAKEAKEIEEFERSVQDSVFVVGKYAGKTAAEVAETDILYIDWLNEETVQGRSHFNINIAVAKAYVEEIGGLKYPGHIGSVGDTVELELKLSNVVSFNGAYGTSWCFTSVTKTGEMVVFFTTAKKFLDLEVGSMFKITGLVRDHKKRGNFNQTMINKPKMIK